MDFFTHLAGVVVAIVLSLFGVHQQPAPTFGDTTSNIGGTTYNISGSGVSSSATSITLVSLTLPQTGQKLRTSDLSTTFYVTLEPGSRTRQEFASCTTVTQNAAGTATLSGCTRGLSPITPYTASSTLQFAHSGGSQVIFSDPPQLFNQYTAKTNDESISGTWTFTNSPLLTTACTGASSNSALCDKAYIDGVAVAGASNANETTKGIGEIATGREAASSTLTGSTAARLFLPASLASSSPWSTSTSTLVMTRLDGKINPLFFATSSNETYNWGALMNFTGTTSISASSTTTNPLKLNGLAYSFPSIMPTASSTVWMNNGSGSMTLQNSPNLLLYQNNFVNVGSSAAATTTLALVTIPGGTLGTLNRSLRINGLWTDNLSGTGCAPDIEYGNGVSTSTLGYISENGDSSIMQGQATIMATSSTAQVGISSFVEDKASVGGTNPSVVSIRTSYNLANNTYIAFAQASKGGTTCTFIGGTVELLTY